MARHPHHTKKIEKAKEPEVPPVRVRATQAGVYGNLREPGTVFLISGETYTEQDKEKERIPKDREVGDIKAFSDRWMEFVDEEGEKQEQPQTVKE